MTENDSVKQYLVQTHSEFYHEWKQSHHIHLISPQQPLAEHNTEQSHNNNNNDRLTAFDPGQPG